MPPAFQPHPRMAVSQSDLDRARVELLRQRVTIFGGVLGGLLMVLAGVQWLVATRVLGQTLSGPGMAGMLAGAAVGLALIGVPFIRRGRHAQATLRSLVWKTIVIVVVSVLSLTFSAGVLSAGLTEAIRPFGFQGNLGPIWVLIIFMVFVHSVAACIVPWTVGEAAVPPLTWVALTTLSAVTGTDSVRFIVFGVSLTVLAGLPGIAIAFARSGLFRETVGFRLVGARFAEVERELSFARRLHERLFPAPISEGPVRLEYAYEPMRQIGGDYLDVARSSDGSMWVVMIDVTGHGVAAALAVNRLHGELKRLLAEGAASPAGLLAGLNRYVHQTLADESVFATGVVARIWPNGRTMLCVAGHPPPLLRHADGRIESVESTAAMLGPFAPDVFDGQDTEVHLTPGQALMLYTDGVVECRGASGRQLGQSGLERILAGAPGDERLAPAILAGVTGRRVGSAEDDVLIAVVRYVGGG